MEQDKIEYRTIARVPGWRFGSDGSAWQERSYGWVIRADGHYGRRRLVRVRIGGRLARTQVGALVLEAFVGPRPPGGYVKYRNGRLDDDRPENLEWGHLREVNAQNSRLRASRPGRGGRRAGRMWPEEARRGIAMFAKGATVEQVAEELQISRQASLSLRSGRSFDDLPRPWNPWQKEQWDAENPAT